MIGNTLLDIGYSILKFHLCISWAPRSRGLPLTSLVKTNCNNLRLVCVVWLYGFMVKS